MKFLNPLISDSLTFLWQHKVSSLFKMWWCVTPQQSNDIYELIIFSLEKYIFTETLNRMVKKKKKTYGGEEKKKKKTYLIILT